MMTDADGRTNQEPGTSTKWPTHAKPLRRQESAGGGAKVGRLFKLSACQDAQVVDKLKTYPTLKPQRGHPSSARSGLLVPTSNSNSQLELPLALSGLMKDF